ncbi:hypothetical protein GCM10027419_37260 [Pandoraea terrae]
MCCTPSAATAATLGAASGAAPPGPAPFATAATDAKHTAVTQIHLTFMMPPEITVWERRLPARLPAIADFNSGRFGQMAD